MGIDKLSDLDVGDPSMDAVKQLESNGHELQQGSDSAQNSFDELHTLTAYDMARSDGLEGTLAGAATEIQDTSLHADGAGIEHLGTPEDGSIAAHLNIIDFTG